MKFSGDSTESSGISSIVMTFLHLTSVPTIFTGIGLNYLIRKHILNLIQSKFEFEFLILWSDTSVECRNIGVH